MRLVEKTLILLTEHLFGNVSLSLAPSRLALLRLCCAAASLNINIDEVIGDSYVCRNITR